MFSVSALPRPPAPPRPCTQTPVRVPSPFVEHHPLTSTVREKEKTPRLPPPPGSRRRQPLQLRRPPSATDTARRGNRRQALASRHPPEAAAGASTKPKAATTKLATRGRAKHVKAPPKPKPEMDYFPEKREKESGELVF